MNPLRRILFVCTGNTCRSPMAEHLFRKLLADAGITGVETRSAGVAPAEGMLITPQAIAALDDNGVRGVRHAARRLDAAAVDWADAIFAMEPTHRDRIAASYPPAAGKTHVLKIFAGTAAGRPGIADPFGGDDADYRVAI